LWQGYRPGACGSFSTTSCNPGTSAKSLAFDVSKPEPALDRLRREPQVVDPDVRVPAGLPDLRGEQSERVSRVERHAQLRLALQAPKHRRCALPLRAGAQQLQPEADLGHVHWREIHRSCRVIAWMSAAPSTPRSTAIQRLVSINQPMDS
jgi:hypothetical protein